MRLRASLTSGLPAYLAEAGWPHCCSARAFHGAHAPATRRPRHQNGCEAEPGTCWGMLRANHLVNRHEQGVRTMGRAGRATVTPGSARTGGGQKYAALVVRREYSTNPAQPDVRPACHVLRGYRSDRGARALLGYTNSLLLVVPDDQRGR